MSDGPVELEPSRDEAPDTAVLVATPPDTSVIDPTSFSIPLPERAVDKVGQPLQLAIDDIHPNPHQPRQSIDDAKVAELAASVKSTGIIQPIVVRRAGESYQLIAGERRWRAARMAGLSLVPAIVREVSSHEQAQMAL